MAHGVRMSRLVGRDIRFVSRRHNTVTRSFRRGISCAFFVFQGESPNEVVDACYLVDGRGIRLGTT